MKEWKNPDRIAAYMWLNVMPIEHAAQARRFAYAVFKGSLAGMTPGYYADYFSDHSIITGREGLWERCAGCHTEWVLTPRGHQRAATYLHDAGLQELRELERGYRTIGEVTPVGLLELISGHVRDGNEADSGELLVEAQAELTGFCVGDSVEILHPSYHRGNTGRVMRLFRKNIEVIYTHTYGTGGYVHKFVLRHPPSFFRKVTDARFSS